MGAGASIQDGGRTITLTATHNFAVSFAYAEQNSVMVVGGNTFSGAATGTRYTILTGGVISTNGGGPNYLPGNSPGVGGTATGGGYYN